MATDVRLKESLPEITESIVATYADYGRSCHLGHKPLPSRETVIEMLTDLSDLLYPGYGRRQNLHLGNVEYHVGELVDGLHDKLTQQVARTLRHEHEQEQENGTVDFEAIAQQVVVKFLQRLPELRMILE